MELFYLEIPSLARKNEIIDYINEFVQYKSEINGTGGLDKILDGYTFEQVLERCLNMQYEEYAKKLSRCQSKTFLLIRKNDNKIIGTINVRWNLTEEMKNTDQLYWVGMMNNFKNQAEEIVLKKLIYV